MFRWFYEKFLTKILGDLKPTPESAFMINLTVLKFFGLWKEESDSLIKKIWSVLNRAIMLYLYVVTQILYFVKVKDLNDAAEVIFLLLTQILMLFKVNSFAMKFKRIKILENEMKSTIFKPQTETEEKFIKNGVAKVLSSQMIFFVLCIFTVMFWALTPLFLNEYKLPIAAWYPYLNDKHPIIFGILFVYQMTGICFSATYNITIDFMAIGVIALMESQVNILKLRLSKIGFKENELMNHPEVKDQEYTNIEKEINKLAKERNQNYAEIVRCHILHKKVIEVTKEIEDIYKESTFGQFCASCFIICMTLVQLAGNVESILQLFSLVSYLLTMLFQIGVFCWFGNDLSFSSKELSDRAFEANFRKFDNSTAKSLQILMMFMKDDIEIKSGVIFKVSLSVSTLLMIVKSSYSYFTLLRTIQEN